MESYVFMPGPPNASIAHHSSGMKAILEGLLITYFFLLK